VLGTHVSICARRNPPLLVGVVGSARIEENRRNGVERADLAAEFKAVEIWQPGVQQIKVEAFRLDQGLGLCSGWRARDFNSMRFQHLTQHLASV